MPLLEMATWNMRGLGSNSKFLLDMKNKMLAKLKSEFHVIALQEVGKMEAGVADGWVTIVSQQGGAKNVRCSTALLIRQSIYTAPGGEETLPSSTGRSLLLALSSFTTDFYAVFITNGELRRSKAFRYTASSYWLLVCQQRKRMRIHLNASARKAD